MGSRRGVHVQLAGMDHGVAWQPREKGKKGPWKRKRQGQGAVGHLVCGAWSLAVTSGFYS